LLSPALISLLWLTGAGMTAARAQAGAPPSDAQAGHQTAPAAPGAGNPEAEIPFQLNGQMNYILQHAGRFRSPYEGTNSFLSRNETEISMTYTLYMGARLRRNLELYIDPEEASGKGLSQGLGIAGFTDGDVVRNPSLSQEPYLARYFVRWTIATGAGAQHVDGGQNQVAGVLPANRLVLSGGKLAVSDYFDVNRYANSTHTNFLNWALINNGAYDYAADTRGYTRGVVAEWVHPAWALRFGSFQMPTVANGIDMASNVAENRGDNLELELHPPVLGRQRDPLIVRLLGYRNLGHMGNYREAITLAQQTDSTADITKAEHNGNRKYGFGLNVEQPLADGGDTGLFGRLGWNDGKTESYVYTEIDRTASAGFQLSGARWKRAQDRFGVAYVHNDLSSAHRDYLAAGGLGFILGDGRLRYGSEQIAEAYYALSLTRGVTIGPDFQHIVDPGYNQDRGPANVESLRFHAEF
jgi:hypothetical protein